MKRQNTQGSAHAIIIILLVVALLGTLGVIFYQNFIAKKPVDTNTSQREEAPSVALKTHRAAFRSNIYALDYPDMWTVQTEPGTTATKTTLTNPDKTVRVTVTISEGSPGGNCDLATPRKVRFYQVSSTAVTKLSDSTAYIVEAMTDAEGGGYDYKIGLTEDGGATHASVGDPYCTVDTVGLASRQVVNSANAVQPAVVTSIDFPKMAAGTDMRVKEMQPVKDMLGTDDYKAAVKILQSLYKE